LLAATGICPSPQPGSSPWFAPANDASIVGVGHTAWLRNQCFAGRGLNEIRAASRLDACQCDAIVGLDRDLDDDARAPAVRFEAELATDRLNPLAHAREPVACRPLSGAKRDPSTVVFDRDADHRVIGIEHHLRRGSLRVAPNIREGFVDRAQDLFAGLRR
jgi:hypothetical protein